MADTDTIRLVVDMGGSAQNIQAASKQVDALAATAEKAGSSSKRAAQGMLDLGRSVQDFAAAGLPGILNNVEGLARALGAGAGIAGVATIAAVGLSLVADSLKKVWDNLKAEDVKRMEAMDAALASMEKHTGELTGKLRDLEAAQSVELKGVREMNEALGEQVRLVEARQKAAAAPEARAMAQTEAGIARAGAPGLGEQAMAPSRAARAAALKGVVGGGEDDRLIRDRVRVALRSVKGGTGKSQATLDREADELMGRFYAGDEDALAQVIGALQPSKGMEAVGQGPARTAMIARLRPLTPGAQFAAGARQVGRAGVDAARGMVEGAMGRVGAVGEAAQEELRRIGRLRAEESDKLLREIGPGRKEMGQADAFDKQEAVRRVEARAQMTRNLANQAAKKFADTSAPGEAHLPGRQQTTPIPGVSALQQEMMQVQTSQMVQADIQSRMTEIQRRNRAIAARNRKNVEVVGQAQMDNGQ